MKSSRYTPEQVAFGLRPAEEGTPVFEVCRKMGISEQTFYRWTKKFQGMGVAEQGYRIWKYRGFHLGSLVMASGIFGFNPLDIR